MFAHHDFVLRNVIRIGGVLLRLSLTIGLLTLHASLAALALVQLALLRVRLLTVSVPDPPALSRHPHQPARLRLADGARILSFSLYVLLLNAGARLCFETDALVIGAFVGVDSIPFYVVANSLIVYLMDFVIAIAAVIMPMTTRLRTEGDWSTAARDLPEMVEGCAVVERDGRCVSDRARTQVHRLVDRSVVRAASGPGAADPDAVEPPVPPGPRRRAAGADGPGQSDELPTLVFLATGLLNLVLSIALARPLGLAGVALGTAIPNVLFAVVILIIACRALRHFVSATT